MGAVRSITKRVVRGWRTLVHRTRARGRSRVLVNSFQKSGTHLLVGLVSALPGHQAYGRRAYWHHLNRARVHERKRPRLVDELAELEACLPGEICRGHMSADPAIADFLRRERFVHLFVYRDPRDVVVSLLHWWQSHQEIDVWPFRWFQRLDSTDARLRFLIEGWPDAVDVGGFPRHCDYPDVGARFGEFVPWLTDPGCVAIRFEELRDPQRRPETCRHIARAILGRDDGPEVESAVLAMETGSDPARSRTFRKGGSGEWRETFSAEHITLMKRHAGQLLIDLGYEKDLEW